MPVPVPQPSAAANLFADHAQQLADHAARIKALEAAEGRLSAAVERVRESVDGLKQWIMVTLAAASGGLFLLLAQMLSKH